jgi:hypothetical protein
MAVWLAASVAWAQQPSTAAAEEARSSGAGKPSGNSESSSSGKWGRFELKRENTERGTPEESTKTTLRLEKFLEGPIAVLRLDLPFPDEKTDFAGDPFNPRRGDIKLRARFRPWQAGGCTFSSFVEATFPTADPEDLGSGKYQLSAAVRMIVPLTVPLFAEPKAHKSQFESEIQQVNSVAGDPDRKDINYTKFELTLYDVWRGTFTTKLKLKPTVDWMQNGKSGAVGEIEVGRFFARDWRAWIMLGHRLWGPEEIKGTYETRLELGITRTF